MLVHHVVVFKTKVLYLIQDWKYAYKRHKWKEKVQKNAQFPFVDKWELFAKKLSFEEFNLVFFTADQSAWLVLNQLSQRKERKPQNEHLKLIFWHLLSGFNLRERIHDAVSVTRIAFRINLWVFNKNSQVIKLFICHCSFITLAQYTIVSFLDTLQTGYSPFLN